VRGRSRGGWREKRKRSRHMQCGWKGKRREREEMRERVGRVCIVECECCLGWRKKEGREILT